MKATKITVLKRVSIMALICIIAIQFFPVTIFAQKGNNIIHYTIRQGDTFYLLSMRFNTTAGEIAALNPRKNPDNLTIGEKLKIPAGKTTQIHTVKRGDVLWRIAQEYKSTIASIVKKNYIKDPNLIFAGDILVIPPIDKTGEKKVVWLSGSWKGFGFSDQVTREDYIGAYNIYTSNTIEQLNSMIKDIIAYLAQPLTNNLGQPITDEQGETVIRGGAEYRVDDNQGGYVRYSTPSGRMGLWTLTTRFEGTVNTAGEGFTNGVPVDVEKFVKALFVYIVNYRKF